MCKTKIVKYIQAHGGTVKAEEAVQNGISYKVLSSLAKQGLLVRDAHGVYSLPDAVFDDLFVLQRRDPRIIFSHETALYLHNMAERAPMAHSVTIPSNKRLSPQIKHECKVYYVKDDFFNLGVVEVSSRLGHTVRVYNLERTVCDILRSRNRIDSQTVAAALKNFANFSQKDLGKFGEYAKKFGVLSLARKYLEVLLP